MRRIFLMFCFIPLIAIAQGVDQPVRYEREHNFGDNDFIIVSAEKHGIILLREINKFITEKGDRWEIIHLDTTLNEYRDYEVKVENSMSLVGYEFNNGIFYLLFQQDYSSRGNWEVKSISLQSGEILAYTIENELDIELSHFSISGKSVVLGGEVASKPTIVLYSFKEKSVEVLPGFYRDETKLVELKSNRNNTFNVVLLDKSQATSENILSVKIFSDDGIELLTASASFGRDIKVQTGTVNELKTSDLIVAGTYGDRGSKLSKGFYFINLQPGSKNTPVFTSFTQLQNIFNYLNDRRKNRIKRRIKESTQGDPYEYRLTLAVWDMFEDENSYTLFAEVIDPQYGSVNRPTTYYPMPGYNPWFMPSRSYYRNVYSFSDHDEIISAKYKEAILVSFDKNGKLRWDKALPYKENIELEGITEHAAANSWKNNFSIVYKTDKEEFHVSNYINDKTIISDSLMTVKLSDETDELKFDEDRGRAVYWYNNNYYIWGYAKIQSRVTRNRKTVFYINKLSID